MGKRLLASTLLTGIILSVAPMAGIAEPTEVSIAVEEEVAKEQTWSGKSWAVIKGAGTQVKGVYQSVTKVDERLERKDEQLKLAKKRIIELEGELSEKRFVSGLDLERTKQCVIVFQEFLNTQVEGK